MLKMNYCVLGTNNMDAAIAFYDSLFEGENLQKMKASARMTYWLGEDFAFAVALPFNELPATNGNGTMLGFNVGTSEQVIKLYNKAINLGGTCEGQPNQRGPRFSAYIRDLDKNKICFSD